jgi:O-antigen ligase
MPPIALIYGLSVGIPLTPDARLTVFDLLSIIFVFRYFRVFVSDVYLKRMLVLFVVYFAALIISTGINGTPLLNLYRRGGTALMLLMEISGIYLFLLHAKRRDLGILLVSMMLGTCLYLIYPIDVRMSDEPLKFLLATPMAVLVGGVFFNLKLPQFASRIAISFISLLLAGLFFFRGARNPGGILIVFSVFIWIHLSKDRLQQLMHRRLRLFIYFVVMAVAGYGLIELYTYAAIAGYFGDRAAVIAEFQSQFFGSILLGGRPEILANLAAISESPLVGWGPLAEDFPHQLLLLGLGVYGQDWFENDGSLYHSMIFGAGHEAGIPAMFLWLALLYWCFKACLISLSKHRKHKYFLPLWLSAIWNLLFSPLISLNRPQIAAAVAFAFICFAIPEFQRNRRASLTSFHHRVAAVR